MALRGKKGTKRYERQRTTYTYGGGTEKKGTRKIKKMGGGRMPDAEEGRKRKGRNPRRKSRKNPYDLPDGRKARKDQKGEK